MKYNPPNDDAVLTIITYGSHLYGTNTPKSDFDFKVVSLPARRSMLLGKSLQVERFRFDVNGKPVGADCTMPANGYEAEHTPVQKFIDDYLTGQAYAVETVYAVLQNAHLEHSTTHLAERFFDFAGLCETLAERFVHQNVQGMTGFAMKQTFDYIRRGERLNAASALMEHATALCNEHNNLDRLDTIVPNTNKTVLGVLAERCQLETGSTTNGNRVLQTLKLNGREYTETTPIAHFKAAVQKLIDSYGVRSTAAAETDVDWKSLSHAVRVYQQVIELLTTKWITFPRPNAAALMEIKEGKRSLDEVKALLRELDDSTQALIASSDLPVVTPAFKEDVHDILYEWLDTYYQS